MANQDKQNPPTGREEDISKAQSAQQPPAQASQQPPSEAQRDQPAETGQAEADQPDEGQQGETLTGQRTDIEGASLRNEKGEAESGFVGTRGETDTSAALIQDDDDDEQFAPEGK